MKVYKKLFSYVPQSKINGVIAIAFSAVSAICSCIGYYFVYTVLLAILISNDYEAAQQLAFKAVVALTLGGLLYFIAGMFSHILGFRLETNLRKKGIEGISTASFRFFDIHESGIIRKTIDDNAAMTHTAVAHMIPDLGQAVLTPIFMILLGFVVSIEVGVGLIVAVLIGTLLLMKMMGGEVSFMELYQEALKKLSGETVEYVRGIQVIKIFKADVKSFKALYEAIMNYSENAYAYSKSCKVPYVIYQWMFLGAVSIVSLPVAFYLQMVENKEFFFIKLMMFLFLLGLIYVSVMRIMYMSQHIFNAKYAVENLEKIYDEMQKDKLNFGSDTNIENYDISFENMDFAYGEKAVFKDFNLKLEAGRSYALVGASGSGKSTLAKLLSGFYKVDKGSIKIGNKKLESYTQQTITKAISFVFQDPKLFKISIYENVALAKPEASKDEVLKALELAGCTDILDKFPERENTLIGTKGVYLSGGEKQRISIARAILKGSPILVMDEASAAIDADNEYKLQESFKNLMKDKTVIMIAHRLSSIENVDEILVLKNGNVIERGNHRALIEKNGEYKNLLDLYHTTNDWRLNNETVF